MFTQMNFLYKIFVLPPYVIHINAAPWKVDETLEYIFKYFRRRWIYSTHSRHLETSRHCSFYIRAKPKCDSSSMENMYRHSMSMDIWFIFYFLQISSTPTYRENVSGTHMSELFIVQVYMYMCICAYTGRYIMFTSTL